MLQYDRAECIAMFAHTCWISVLAILTKHVQQQDQENTNRNKENQSKCIQNDFDMQNKDTKINKVSLVNENPVNQWDG